MKIIKKLILITALFSAIPFIHCLPETTAIEENSKIDSKEGPGITEKAILTSFFINTAVACYNDNFIPIKTVVPVAIIIGIGMKTLDYLDKKALKKNPTCGSNKRNSFIFQSIVLAAGLIPIVRSYRI